MKNCGLRPFECRLFTFITETKQLFEKLEPLPSLEWQLKKVYENLRLEYKIYITRNSFKNFAELEILGCEWEAVMAKSRMKGQQIKIWESNRNDRLYTREQERTQEQQNDHSQENTTYKTDHNSSQDMPTTKRNISITTREDKTHTLKIEVLTNFKIE